MTDALYHALIVEHDRSPRNEGPLDGATNSATLDNPLCGDVVTMHVIVGERVERATFEARGCALCRAAASMLTTRVIGHSPGDIAVMVANFEAFVAGGDTSDMDFGDLVAFRGLQSVRSRRTCATLPFRALANALVER